MSFYFEDQTSPQIGDYARRNALIIIPVGMIEQHGPHLPVSTDNIIARGVASLLAERIQDEIPTLVMPCVFSGYNGENVNLWPGSAKVLPETLYHYVFDMCEALIKGGFKKIMFINSHGQNPAILELVSRRLTDLHGVIPVLTFAMGMIGKEGAAIRTSAQGGAGTHACEIETSLVLALKPDLVDMSLAPNSTCRYRSPFHPADMYPEEPARAKVYMSMWELQRTDTGVLGDASAATAEKGKLWLDMIINNYVDLAHEYYHLEENLPPLRQVISY